MFAPGAVIADRYRLVQILGGGGMGVVWSAKNEIISRDVAIKVMHPRVAEDPNALQRFFAEARVCGSIRHPGIVDVLDLGSAEDGSPFLVMELLHGESVEARIEREGRLAAGMILPIVRDVARTLALAHEQGVIHRDLKPANLFLHRMATGEVVVKVLDFGISKVLTQGASFRTTRTGAVVGSPAYMSPEQALGKKDIDGRTDIYSLGVVLYEALAGRLPFQSDNYNALIVEIATEDPPRIETLVPGLPPPIAELVRDAMAREVGQRIRTMAELADRIDKILPLVAPVERTSGLPAPRPPQPSHHAGEAREPSGMTATQPAVLGGRRRPWMPIGAVALGAATAALIALAVLSRGPEAGGTQELAAPGESLAAPPPVTPDRMNTGEAAPSVTPLNGADLPPVEPTARASASPASSAAASSAPAVTPRRSGGGSPRPTKKKPPSGGGAWGYD